MICEDRQSGSLLSGGLAVTAPTGPDAFANTHVFIPVHTTVLTPYVGYILRCNQFYVQGFTSVYVPTGDDVTIISNDVQLGYDLFKDRDTDRCLTGLSPFIELHLNDPVNHRGALNTSDPLGTPDWLDLTAGVTFEFRGCSTLALGFVTPVTGPKPYDFEALAQFNIRFGRSVARGGQPQTANVAGD